MQTPTPHRRPSTQRKQRISTLFWALAANPGAITDSREPDEVVRHLLSVLETLEGRVSESSASANALSFLLQLEHDSFYASPEQTRGGEKDSRALVYSIGVLLFERLTGHHPFVESLSPLQSRVTRDRARSVGGNNLCSIPGDLRGVLVRAMSPFPEERHRDVAELHADLELYLGRADTVIAPLPQRRALGSQPPVRLARGSQPMARPRRRSAPPPCPGSTDRAIYDMVMRTTTRAETAATVVRAIPQPPPIPQRAARPSRGPLHLVAGAAVLAALTLGALVWAAAGSSAGSGGGGGVLGAAAAAPAVTPTAIEVEEPAPAAIVPEAETSIVVPALPRAFDPELAATAAMARARACFSDAELGRGVQIDATLRFSADTGDVDKVYFGSRGLRRAQRTCVSDGFIGVSAGAAPDANRMVTYTFWLSATSERFHIAKRS